MDHFLPSDLETQLIEAMAWMPLYFVNEYQRVKSHELDIHWLYPIAAAQDIRNDDVETELLQLDQPLQALTQCWNHIKEQHAYPVRLYSCVLSANAFGTEGRIHRDLLLAGPGERDRHHTALFYCNKEWRPEWGGETLVLSDDGSEITFAVMPKPGRMVMWRGDPLHVGRSVTRICPSDRRVLVFKYWQV